MTTVPQGAALLLAFIRETETGRADRSAYDTIYAHKEGRLPKPLTSMTLGEIIDAQRKWSKNHGSSAAGAYQFMRATLIDLSKELNLRGDQIFFPTFQDRLGFHLLERRGYRGWEAGQISDVDFAKRLAMEWASLPVLADTKGAHRTVKRGQSYYAGDGLNKSLVSPEKVETVLDRARKAATAPVETAPAEPTAVPPPAQPEKEEALGKSKRFWTWLLTAIGAPAAAFGALDWRVQLAIVVVIVGFAIYAIQSMPAVRKKLGLG